MNLIPAFEMFKRLIHYESSQVFNYSTNVTVTKSLENKAKQLKLEKFMKISSSVYHYNHNNGNESVINIANKTCSCRIHTDKGIC